MPDPKPSTAAPRLKLVIRRLPPTIPEDIFWASIAQWVDAGKSTWRRWYQGKKADDTVRQHRVFSRAYVMMADFEKLRDFAAAFDGHVFRGKDGTEYQAVVEYAPSQKIPSQKSKPRVDARQGQIDKDPDFLSFLESLSAPVVKPDVTTLAASEPYDKHQSTPLLDFLREQRQGKRGAAGSGLSDVAGTKDARTRREKEREKIERKRLAAAGGDKPGNGKQGNPGRMTTGGASSVGPSTVPGQIKIAKRPSSAIDDASKDARQQRKGVPVALPDAGKRAEVKIQVKTGQGNDGARLAGQGQAQGGPGQAGKGKPTRVNGGNIAKAPRLDGPSKQAEQKPRITPNNRSTTPQPPSAITGETPQSTQPKRAPRPPANLQGSRNLLTAALKSSTRDASPRNDPADPKPARNRGGKPSPSGPAVAGATGTAGEQAQAGEKGEKAKRPPRNRGRKGPAAAAAGDGPASGKPGDQAGAQAGRIDA